MNKSISTQFVDMREELNEVPEHKGVESGEAKTNGGRNTANTENSRTVPLCYSY